MKNILLKKIIIIILLIVFGISVFFVFSQNKETKDNKIAVEENATTSEDIITNDAATTTEDEIKEDIISYTPLTDEEIDDIMAAGINWLKRSQEDNGHFLYEYSPLSDAYSQDDLMVRQTGALYILGEVLKKDQEK